MDTKKIVVACGTGGVTSKNIAMKIEKYLKGKGIDAKTSTCRVSEVAALVSQIHPDVVCSATQLPPLDDQGDRHPDGRRCGQGLRADLRHREVTDAWDGARASSQAFGRD